jgi:serine/threonine-protein kinase
MNEDRWKQIEEIFYEALDMPEYERSLFLKKACGTDPELFSEVQSLLLQEDKTGAMLKTIISKATEIISQEEFADLVGKRIGPYRITGLIGQGGMAEVYKAVRDDDEYQKSVAIKLIRRDKVSFLISRFWHERQILANLEHSNIARFLEGGTTKEGIPYLVMEYIEGLPITTYCEKHALTIRQRLELFRYVCNAVQYAHRNLVIHRDLKPSNIWVTSEGIPKLLDFGIAKLLNPEMVEEFPSATVTSMRMMTPEYASPEQVRGDQVTTATDVYSLGAVLYELLTNEQPYKINKRSLHEIERIICEEDPEPPSSMVARSKKMTREFSRELDNILLMAMYKDPQQRYSTVAQFAEDITRYLDGLPILARTPTVRYRALKFARRHRMAVTIATFIVLMLAGFAVVMTIQASRIAKERDRANQVTGFLVNLFEVSNPSESKGNSVTARELLDGSVQKIQKDLQNQPEVQASLLDTAGRVYGNLGLYKTAIPILEKALEIRKKALGEENPEVASAMNNLAEALFSAGKYDEAEPLARKALAMRRKLLGNEHPDVANSLSNLGGGLHVTGKYQEAESVFREALAIRKKKFGEEHEQVAVSLTQLALVLSVGEKQDEAETLNRRALAIRRKVHGNDHPEIATSLNNLGRRLLDKGEFEEAELMFREAVELDRKILGKDHPDLAISMSSLAYALKGKKQYVEAEKLFREALALRRKALGDEHPAVGGNIVALASLLVDKGNHDAAEPLIHEAQSIFQKKLPPEHINHAVAISMLGKICMGRGNYKEGEQLLLQAIKIYNQTLPSDHPRIANVRSTLGECLTKQGRYQDAESILLDSYRIFETKRGVKHLDTIETAARLNSLYTAWGKPDQAARYRGMIF